MNTRYILYYIAGRIALILITVFVFPETGFIGFLQKYRGYLIIVSISYFTYCYYLPEEEKKFEYLRNSIAIFNVYLTLHIFFRPLLNIEPALFLLLGCILLGMRYLSTTHLKYKQPFYYLGGIFSVLILISGIFYLYPEAPNLNEFLNQQTYQLLLSSPITQPKPLAYIHLIDTDTQKSQTLLFQTGIQTFSLPQSYQISYISTSPDNEGQLFLLFPNANLLQILPQSVIKNTNTLQLETGTFTRHSALRTGEKENTTFNELPATKEETYQTISSPYRQRLQSFLTTQIGSPFLANPTIQQINKSVLTFLHRIFPGFFGKNLENYYQFEYYFSLFNTSENIINKEKYNVSHTIDTQPTNLFQQLKNNLQLSTPNLNIF